MVILGGQESQQLSPGQHCPEPGPARLSARPPSHRAESQAARPAPRLSLTALQAALSEKTAAGHGGQWQGSAHLPATGLTPSSASTPVLQTLPLPALQAHCPITAISLEPARTCPTSSPPVPPTAAPFLLFPSHTPPESHRDRPPLPAQPAPDPAPHHAPVCPQGRPPSCPSSALVAPSPQGEAEGPAVLTSLCQGMGTEPVENLE